MHEQNLPVNHSQWNGMQGGGSQGSHPQPGVQGVQAFQSRGQGQGQGQVPSMYYGAGPHPMQQGEAARGGIARGHMNVNAHGHMMPGHAHVHGQFVDSSSVLRANQQNMPATPAPSSTIPTSSIPTHSQLHPSVGMQGMQGPGAMAMQHMRGGNQTSKVAKGKMKGRAAGLVGDVKKPSTGEFQLKKKRKGGKGNVSEKGGKGLRHFSMKVCAKVESKGRTTYNEVADELVAELSTAENGGSPDSANDDKNIRRRVYDALNVLMAMDIISKEKKEISWRGLPTTRENNFDILKEDQKRVNEQIEKKQLYLKELRDQKKAIEALIERNKANPQQPTENQDASQCTGVQLPFLVVQTKPDAKVDVQISEDRQFVSFDFQYNPFEIHDENYVLAHMVRNKKL